MSGMLRGIKVLEMANVISGPYGGMLLADMGAEVLKVEMPGSGDPFRNWAEGEGQVSPAFAAFNRGKKSVTINVKEEAGRAVYRRLAAEADVILDNFRPGTLDRLGIGYKAVREDNPQIIYCAVTGMGSTGPYRDRPTYDAIAQAMSGLWSQLTDLRDPEPVGPPLSDQLTGLFAAYGILAALVSRLKTGMGRKLDVNMLSASLAFQPLAIADQVLSGRIADKTSRARISQSYAFVAGDDLPFAVHLSSPPKFWAGLLAAVDRPELADDFRFARKPDREAHYDILHDLLQDIFASGSRQQWLDQLAAHDVPVGPINTITEALDDPQVKALGLMRTFGEGERALDLFDSAISDGSPPASGAAVPNLGEHTDQVLAELGFSVAECQELKRNGAI